MAVFIQSLTGDDIRTVLPDLARLRMEVFREWPYLYDGSLAYEEDYLSDPINYLISNAPQTRVGNVDQFGLNIGLRLDNGWDLTLYCKNCTDENVPAATAIDAGDSAVYGTASVVQSWGFNSVRNIGLRASYSF